MSTPTATPTSVPPAGRDQEPPSAGQATTVVQAPAARLYTLISDVTRMGDWSPECTGAEIDPGVAVIAGAEFTGINSRDGNAWTTCCRVLDATEDSAWWSVLCLSLEGDLAAVLAVLRLVSEQRPAAPMTAPGAAR